MDVRVLARGNNQLGLAGCNSLNLILVLGGQDDLGNALVLGLDGVALVKGIVRLDLDIISKRHVVADCQRQRRLRDLDLLHVLLHRHLQHSRHVQSLALLVVGHGLHRVFSGCGLSPYRQGVRGCRLLREDILVELKLHRVRGGILRRRSPRGIHCLASPHRLLGLREGKTRQSDVINLHWKRRQGLPCRTHGNNDISFTSTNARGRNDRCVVHHCNCNDHHVLVVGTE